LRPEINPMKSFYILSFTLLLSLSASAQGFRFNAFGAYAFDDRVDRYNSSTSYFDGTLKGAFLYGAGIEYEIRKNTWFEVLYQRMDSDAPMTFSNGNFFPKYKTFNYGLNYIMMGGSKSVVVADGKLEPFGGIDLGMAIFQIKNPEPGGRSSLTKFAWGAKLGAIIWPTPKVGLRLQFQVNSAVQAVGGGAYFGTGGAGVGVSTYSTMFQPAIGGGLVFKMNP